MNRTTRYIGAIWGVAGILLLLGWAVLRLSPYTVEAIQSGLSTTQWLVLIIWSVFMLISEGHQGIGKGLAPRVAERALHVRQKGDWLEVILAPLYCFGYFRASKKRLIISYAAITLIICAVVIVHQFAQPWRGIVDAGVVLGLVYGGIAVASRSAKALFADHQLKIR